MSLLLPAPVFSPIRLSRSVSLSVWWGTGNLHTVAQEKAETETGEMGQERRTKLKRGQARGGRRDEEIRRRKRRG